MLVAFSFARKFKSVKRRQPEIGPAVSLYGQSRYICHVFVRINALIAFITYQVISFREPRLTSQLIGDSELSTLDDF